MGGMSDFRSAQRTGRCWLKRFTGALLMVVVVGGAVFVGTSVWRWLYRPHWIQEDLGKGLTVARREHRKVLLLISEHW